LVATPASSADGGESSSIGLFIGVAIVVLLVMVGVYFCGRRNGRRHQFGDLLPVPSTVSVYVNPLHREPAGESVTDYEEPVSPPHSPHITMDPDLYVRLSNDAGQGSTAVRQESGSVTYAVPLQGWSATSPDYMEIAGGDAAGTPAAYAVFQSTRPTDEIPSTDTSSHHGNAQNSHDPTTSSADQSAPTGGYGF
jgi:hypothetical protein